MEKSILNHLNEGIIIFDENYKVKYCNQSVLEKFNILREDIIYRNIREFINLELIHLNEECELTLNIKNQGHLRILAEVIMTTWEEEKAYGMIIKKYIEEEDYFKKLKMIIDNLPYAIWIYDEKGVYKYANHNATDIVNKIRKKNTSKQNHMEQVSWEQLQYQHNTIDRLQDEKILKQGELINEERKITIENQEVKYYMVKIPIIDEYKKYRGYIEIDKYNLFEEELEKIISRGYINLDNSQISNEAVKVENIFEFSKTLEYVIEAHAITVFKYRRERGDFQGIFRLGKISGQLLIDIEQVIINQKQYEKALQLKKMWRLEELEKIIECNGIDELKKVGIQYVYLQRIEYNGEVLGAMISGYKDNIRYLIMEREIQRDLGKYIGSLFKNNQLLSEVKEEFIKRQSAEEELKAYLSLAVDFLFVIDPEGRAIKWNDAWTTLLGWSAEDITRLDYKTLIHPDEYEAAIEVVRRGKEDKSVIEIVNRYKHKNGSYKLLRCTVKFDEKKQVYFGIAKDITEERKREEEAQAYKQALELETLKTEFLANMSHELKTPLNIIYSMIQLGELEVNQIAEEYGEELNFDNIHRYGEVSKQNVYRLLRLINNITDISRIGAGYYQARLVNCDVVRVVEDITMSVVEYVRNKDLNIIFDTEVEELIMACDPDKMERIMLNLLSNAVKYTNEGDEIWVNISVDKDLLVISVADNGIGIPEEKQKAIFERFVQVDTSFRRKREGSGIGLALVKSLLEQQKGTIKVESILGQGSVFTITLPIYRVEETIQARRESNHFNIDRCKIEFSDIYDL